MISLPLNMKQIYSNIFCFNYRWISLTKFSLSKTVNLFYNFCLKMQKFCSYQVKFISGHNYVVR